MTKFTNLGNILAEEVLNEPGICFYPARFKIPHLGHWNAVTDLSHRNYIKKVVILISPKEVDGITQEDSYKIWQTFLKASPNTKVQVQKSTEESPVKDVYAYLAKHPLDQAVYLAYNEGEDDDPGYAESLQKAFGDKVKRIAVQDKAGDITSPKVRDMLSAGDYDGYIKAIPPVVIQKGYGDDIFKLVAPHTTDSKPQDLQEAAFPQPLSYRDKLDKFVRFVVESLGIMSTPRIEYVSTSDFTQEQHSFGGYIPGNNSIMVVVANRNLADIMRSLAHELVHARQNQDGGLSAEQGETGSEIENQANAVAGIIMRNYGKIEPDIYLDFIAADQPTVRESLLENLSVINNEREEILRAAEEEGIDEIELQNAFRSGKLVQLTDSIWSQIENTDSYDIRNRKDAITLANEYGKDWEPIDQAVKTGQELPLPLVLKHKDKLTLVGGNTRLMFYRAYKKYPEVLLATISESNKIK